MKNDPLLERAANFAKKRDFENAFKILQDEEDRYYGSFKYYQLSGIISLHSGNYVEAHEYLQLARRIKPKDKITTLGFAIHYLKKMNTVQAVDCYLDVLEKDPKNKIAKYALNIIRKHSSPETLSDWIAMPDNLSKLFPPIPVTIINKKLLINITLGISLLTVLAFGIYYISKEIKNRSTIQSSRQTTEFVLSQYERDNPIETGTGNLYRYILTYDQAINIYERALSLFTSYRDEAAKINLNHILESNASSGLKNRARLLIDNMETPGFHNFRRDDNVSFTQVSDEPFLYKDVHVIWHGMAFNVDITNEKTSFDFVIGYDTRRIYEGIVSVEFDGPVAINMERPLEVLGRIKVSPPSLNFWLEGISVHQSGRLEN
ncbi:MAG: tetratricopeptide repeat protein [Treponema sp.]|jgi:tetratricopeptide (TPR) repeat protein|nr:tetratricopeptide repeat protein [Treponema sp.]